MSLLWPGDHRAGELMSDVALLRALVDIEAAWLRTLTDHAGLQDLDRLAIEAERGGDPVIPLVALLRSRLPEPARTWLHRGLTSQDVMDTVLGARDAVHAVRAEVTVQIDLLTTLVEAHRGTLIIGRTLTQPATPITFGDKTAGWLAGLLDADAGLASLDFPVQLGGAAGTLSGLVDLPGLVELGGVERAQACRASLPGRLGLSRSLPWHTRRTPVTRIGDAVATIIGGWGRIAGDVLVLAPPGDRRTR